MRSANPALKVGFVSLGCPKNLVDSEVMMGLLARCGYELTPRAQEADVLVVNTCSFIESAQEESVEAVLEMAEYKKSGSAKTLIVAGCLAERYRAKIMRQIPEVDAVIGTGEIERIVAAAKGDLYRSLAPAASLPDVNASALAASENAKPAPPTFLYDDLMPRVLSTPSHTAYIKIAEGCEHACGFCIIPQLRGAFRSRDPESVVREAQALARAGIREVTLIGQDTTSYGEDLGIRDGLAQLLERLARLEDLFWVRFLYCYPNRITPRLLETVAAHSRLARYLDIPLQHASRSILAAMRRGSSGDAFLKRLDQIRAVIPGVSVRTSLIVGFPGETRADFEELCDLVQAAEFDWLGVFEYCDVEGAASRRLPGKVEADTIAERRGLLMAIQRKLSRKKLRARVGGTETAIVEGPSKENPFVWEGRLEGMAPEIDGKLFLSDLEPLPGLAAQGGDVVRVEVTDSGDYDLVGRVLEILPRTASQRLAPLPAEGLRHILTGAPLRVLG
jgi:ribosomal protein S12 methylthiotransferase